MRVPQFDESLRTGQPLIDEQHEWLFKLAARVAQMMGPLESGEPAGIGVGVGMASGEETNSPQVQNAAIEAVYGLLDYATEHFSDEEALQRESHYPLANMHAALHEDLNLRLAPFVLSEVGRSDNRFLHRLADLAHHGARPPVHDVACSQPT